MGIYNPTPGNKQVLGATAFGAKTLAAATFQNPTGESQGSSPTITPSPIVLADALPTSPNDLWEPWILQSHDWAEGVTVGTRWPVTITKSRSDSEQRFLLTTKPRRRVTLRFHAWGGRFPLFPNPGVPGETEIGNLRQIMQRYANARVLVPLPSDRSRLNPVDLDVRRPDGFGWDSPNGKFGHRRYFPAGRMLFTDLIADPSKLYTTQQPYAQLDWRTIASVSSTQLLTDSGEGVLPVMGTGGHHVWPALEGELMLDSLMVMETSEHALYEVTVLETPGASALDAVVDAGAVPTGASSYDGLPIFDVSVNWATDRPTAALMRAGDRRTIGLDHELQLYGDKARWIIGQNQLELSRAAAWRMLEWWDSRRGQTLPFWILSPSADFPLYGQPSDLPADTINVGMTGLQDVDWTYITHIGAIAADGTFRIAKIASVVDWPQANPPYSQITFEAGQWPDELVNPRRVTIAHKVRFNQDEFEERWITDEAMETDLSFVEIPNERDEAIVITDICPGGTPDEADFDACLVPPLCEANRCPTIDTCPESWCEVCLDEVPVFTRDCWCTHWNGEACGTRKSATIVIMEATSGEATCDIGGGEIRWDRTVLGDPCWGVPPAEACCGYRLILDLVAKEWDFQFIDHLDGCGDNGLTPALRCIDPTEGNCIGAACNIQCADATEEDPSFSTCSTAEKYSLQCPDPSGEFVYRVLDRWVYSGVIQESCP